MNTKRFFASILTLLLLISCVTVAFAEDKNPADDPLVLSKSAELQSDGTYKIRMEAYTTGTVTTTTSTVPVDIVLVLDQSGSMAYDFNGNSTNSNASRRQYAMKQAVNSFIEAVNGKYSAEADHRMAIVTFGSDASTLQEWTYVDERGANSLKQNVNGLPDSPEGATNAGAGMQQAQTLMGSGYKYDGNNVKRQKVVVFFTDGVPTTRTDFDTSVADSAIAAAKDMKNSDVTIYSVGIFNGVNPNQLHGDKWKYLVYSDVTCTGEVGSVWGGSWAAGLFGGNDFSSIDVPAGNRFLNYVSSNFAGAASIGIESGRYNPGDHLGGSGDGYKITQNYTRTASSYYLTATDSDSLNTIFKTISDQIQQADISLDEETEIRDIITPYFTVPEKTSDIKLYTAAYQGNSKWDAEQEAKNPIVTIKDRTVSVTGFDFNANFVTENTKKDGTHGSKLIIEFTVSPREGFLGGNGVPTNGDKSGVYAPNSETPVGTFEVPTVDVAIPELKVTAKDKNVYLQHVMTADECKAEAEATCGGVNLFDEASYTGENAWKADFVNITAQVTAPEGTLTEDSKYTVTAKVEPKTDGTVKSTTASSTANINVFLPTLTFKDAEAYYGDTVPNLDPSLTKSEWKHGETLSTAVIMTGEAPKLDLTYSPEASKLQGDKLNTKQNVPVDVTVKIGTTDVTDKTTFAHVACTGKTEQLPEGKELLIHIKTCTLDITKKGGAPGETYVFDVYKDNQKYSEVTVFGNNTETLVELPVGTYTIREDNGWSWRYTADNGTAATLSAQTPGGKITCTNAKTVNTWLNGFSDVVRNIFKTN